MIIEQNKDGWSFDESDQWKLVHDEKSIIFYDKTNQSISTQSILLVGTHEECEAEISRLGLKYTHETEVETEVEL